jgi:hypothetical protein
LEDGEKIMRRGKKKIRRYEVEFKKRLRRG